MRAFPLTVLVLGLVICLDGVQGQRQSSRKTTTEAPAYEDYDEYDGSADDDKKGATAAASSTTTTTAAPAEDEEAAKGTHPFLKNRLRLRNRPSPHPAVKAKPTLPSFIKHPANIEDLGHEIRAEQKPTQPPLPRPKLTSAKPAKFSSFGSSRRQHKKPAKQETPKDDYEYEEEDETQKTPQPVKPAVDVKKPARPRRL